MSRPDYTDVKTYVNGASVVAIGIVFPILGAAAILARAWARRMRQAAFGIDGWLCLIAWILLLGSSAIMIAGAATHTIGYHTKLNYNNFDIKGLVTLQKLEFAYNQIWYLAIGLVKLSFLFFYRRIFRGTIFTTLNTILIIITTAWCIVFSLLNIFPCGRHVDDHWKLVPLFKNNQCINTLANFFATGVSDCFIDLSILLLPVYFVFKLKMAVRQKIAVMSIFALGGFCVAAAALRLTAYAELWWEVHTDNLNTSVMGLRGADTVGIISVVLFWSQIELGVAVITSCLPALKPLLAGTKNGSMRWVRQRLSWTNSSRKESPQHTQCARPRSTSDPDVFAQLDRAEHQATVDQDETGNRGAKSEDVETRKVVSTISE